MGAAELLYDVWRLSFRPETNSLAVHISRLRAKLRTSGVDGLVETLPGGAYRLASAAPRRAIPLSGPLTGPLGGNLALDGYARLSEERVPA